MILGLGIWFLAALVSVLLTGSGGPPPVLITIVAGGAILALWAWKPGGKSDSTEIEVKPLDKSDEKRDV